jgi:hypothetical protein
MPHSQHTSTAVDNLGFTIHAVFLNETLPSLSFVDPLLVNESRLPSLGQSISTSSSLSEA